MPEIAGGKEQDAGLVLVREVSARGILRGRVRRPRVGRENMGVLVLFGIGDYPPMRRAPPSRMRRRQQSTRYANPNPSRPPGPIATHTAKLHGRIVHARVVWCPGLCAASVSAVQMLGRGQNNSGAKSTTVAPVRSWTTSAMRVRWQQSLSRS